jgi:hypothetical protein
MQLELCMLYMCGVSILCEFVITESEIYKIYNNIIKNQHIKFNILLIYNITQN